MSTAAGCLKKGIVRILYWFLFSIQAGQRAEDCTTRTIASSNKQCEFSVVGLLADLRTMRDGDDGVRTWLKKIKKLEGVPFEMPVALNNAVTNLLGAPKKTKPETDESGKENSDNKNQEEKEDGDEEEDDDEEEDSDEEEEEEDDDDDEGDTDEEDKDDDDEEDSDEEEEDDEEEDRDDDKDDEDEEEEDSDDEDDEDDY